MANEKTLLEIDGKEINQYIIITDPERLNEDYIKDGGNIVILDNNGRTDLYIGDEHIAGGYGFNEKETAESVLTRIKNLEERTFEDFNLPDKNDTNKTVSIDQEKNQKIIINDSSYELKLEDKDNVQELYIEEYVRPSISNLKFTYINNNKQIVLDKEYIYDIVGVNLFTPFSLTFDYIGALDVKDYEIKYNYEYNIANDYNSEYNLPIIDDKTNKYFNFNFNLGDVGNKECIINLKVKLTLEDNSTIIKTFAKWMFTYPCYYGTELSDIEENIENNQNIFLLTFDNSVKVRFNHENIDNYGELYIPKSILGKNIEKRNIVCISNASNLRFNWNEKQIDNKNLLSKLPTNYWCFETPQKYKGDVEWTFSLN